MSLETNMTGTLFLVFTTYTPPPPHPPAPPIYNHIYIQLIYWFIHLFLNCIKIKIMLVYVMMCVHSNIAKPVMLDTRGYANKTFQTLHNLL